MPRYCIKFMKRVCNDTGHETNACQRAIVVDAESPEAAVAAAQAAFCRVENIPSWSVRSDAFEAEEVLPAIAISGRRQNRVGLAA